ncbi:hypothetical protein P43SY_010370 [Pythium insidiosum]|uniref:Uncharacterized protein n=1 Tax=Pythium insidiosum TaxID=114742 RepID=A0AAD5L538_PYTIN|nr:hypothetical protein P43SY_010370 [Pythium insidiosum]
MHYLLVHSRGTMRAVTQITEKSKLTLARQQQSQPEILALLERFGRMLGDALTSQLREHIKGSKSSKSPKATLLTAAVWCLAEGAKLAEVIVFVSQFVGKWLEIVEAVVVSEAEHLRCIDVSDDRQSFETWNEQQQENGSVTRLELHACGDAVHWRPVDATSVEELKETSTLPRELLEDASTKLRVLDEFDTRDTSKRTVGWTSLRAEMVATLAQVATAFIRNELEQHTNTLARQLTSPSA